MNIQITGANSFIGTYFKNNTSNNVSEVDLLSVEVSEIDFTGVDVVFHVAAIVHQNQGTPDDIYYTVNRDLAFDVARSAKLAGIRQFVFMSTVKVYGENSTEENPWTENTKCFPTDAYGKSKLEAEELLLSLQDDNFTVSIVRTPVVYGAGVKGNILRMAHFVNKYPIVPFGGIDNKRAMVYIGNLVALIDVVIEKCYSGIVLASDEKLLSTSDFVEYLILADKKKHYLVVIPKIFQAIIKIIRPNLYQRVFGSMVIDNSQTKSVLECCSPFSEAEGLAEVMNSINR